MASKSPQQTRLALRRFMATNKLKVLPWTAAAGVPEGSVRNFLKERSKSLAYATLEKLAAAQAVTVAEMLGEKISEPKVARDVVAIRRLNVRASLGGGFEIAHEAETQPIFFRRSWVEDILQGEPSQLRAIDMAGDSMLPTIRDGDIGLAQLQAPFESGKCYALWDGRGLVVKRLEGSLIDPDKLRVVSDNAQLHAPYEVHADEVHIIAKIVWRGGKI
jgi:phage repressor protein C with HTH and peptisase S24 domain